MTMITPSYLGETIEYSSLHACRSTLEDPTGVLASAEVGGCQAPRRKSTRAAVGRSAGGDQQDARSFGVVTGAGYDAKTSWAICFEYGSKASSEKAFPSGVICRASARTVNREH